MKADCWRLLAVLCTSLLVGLFTGQTLLSLFCGLAAYMYWQYRNFGQLLRWLHRRSESEPPESSGLVDEIAREFDFLRVHHKKRKTKLAGFLKRFQQAVGALPDAVVVLGEYDRIEWANDRALQYIGVHWPQDAGQRISNLIRYPELQEFLAEVDTRAPHRRMEILAPGDARLRLEVRVAPYGNRQRLLVARNITRIHRINQMRTDFIANASHELRTPLTVIAGYLETFADDDHGSPERWQDQIRRMRQQTDRMQRLIDDLLTLASLESETEIGAKDSINVSDMIMAISREAKDLSGVMAHKITIHADPNLWLKGKGKELYSAFSNLVFNAIQYSPETAAIEINWYAAGSEAVFEVCDQGDGIAAEHIPRLTERFYRVDAGRSREKGGTGLGLAIVKHVLARHQSKLEIQSILGRGSTFRCSFPQELMVKKPGRDRAISMIA